MSIHSDEPARMSVHSDEPARSDLLSRGQYASAFARLIESCETPLVIGLYGGWGIGKTSLMRLIQRRLEQAECACVWFDAWQHQHDDAPALALLQTVVQQLHLGNSGKKLLMTVALAFGSPLLKLGAVTLWDLKRIGELYEEEQFQVRDARVRLREHFQKLIDQATNEGERRLVIFIDDLDRCTAETALSLLEALKLYLNFQHCVYVLGVDKVAMENAVLKKYGQESINNISYLEKIVQLPFTIPPIPSDSMELFVSVHLPEFLDSCKDLLVRGLEHNPRQVKRFINVLSLNHQLAIGASIPGYDPRVLAKLLLIQYWNVDLYRAIVADQSLFFSLHGDASDTPDYSHHLLQHVFARESEPPRDTPLDKYVYLTQIAGVGDDSALTLQPAQGSLKLEETFQSQVELPSERNRFRLFGWSLRDRRKRLLIVGAGAAADRLLTEWQTRRSVDVTVIGIVDDDPTKLNTRLRGVPVLGRVDDLMRIVSTQTIDQIAIALPSASYAELHRIVSFCLESKTDVVIVPGRRELLTESLQISQVRQVQLEDLFGRMAMQFSRDEEYARFGSRSIIITGGAGSIGAELARQLATFSPAHLVLIDQAEMPLFNTVRDLREKHPRLRLTPVMADVTDHRRIVSVFRNYHPHHVFHAAFYKQVGISKTNIIQVVQNNLLGINTIRDICREVDAKSLTMVSSMRAFHPSSIMGATQRVAEHLLMEESILPHVQLDTRAIRFGNVIGDSGSVVSLWRQQLATGKPLNITHPEATRSFASLNEAVGLFLKATVIPDAARRITMLKVGEHVRLMELAETLVRLAGMEPHVDVPIVSTGLRLGEKLHEDSSLMDEETEVSSVERIRIVKGPVSLPESFAAEFERLTNALRNGSVTEVGEALKNLCPDAEPPLIDRFPEA